MNNLNRAFLCLLSILILMGCKKNDSCMTEDFIGLWAGDAECTTSTNYLGFTVDYNGMGEIETFYISNRLETTIDECNFRAIIDDDDRTILIEGELNGNRLDIEVSHSFENEIFEDYTCEASLKLL